MEDKKKVFEVQYTILFNNSTIRKGGYKTIEAINDITAKVTALLMLKIENQGNDVKDILIGDAGLKYTF